MTTLASLIRLRNWHVDEARRRLSALYAKHTDLVHRQEQLQATMLIEQAKSENMEEGHFLYQSYVQSVIAEREDLAEAVSEIEQQIDEALVVARAAFTELKKVEVVNDQMIERARQDRLRKTQAQMDEIAATLYQRRQTA